MLNLLNLDAVLDAIQYLCIKVKIMQIVSAREFRSNQGKYLNAAMSGQSVLLTSRYGNFKIMPVTDDDSLTGRVCKSLKEMKQIEEGNRPAKSAKAFLDEL